MRTALVKGQSDFLLESCVSEIVTAFFCVLTERSNAFSYSYTTTTAILYYNSTFHSMRSHAPPSNRSHTHTNTHRHGEEAPEKERCVYVYIYWSLLLARLEETWQYMHARISIEFVSYTKIHIYTLERVEPFFLVFWAKQRTTWGIYTEHNWCAQNERSRLDEWMDGWMGIALYILVFILCII